jgi:tetratricopeptide (TPR) repeat protein
MHKLKPEILVVVLLVTVMVGSCSKAAPNKNIASVRNSQPTPVIESTPAGQSSPEKAISIAEAVEDFNAKRYEKAATGFDSIAKADPKNIDARVYLGKTYRALKKDDDAAVAFREALALKADHPEANFHLGNIYFEQKNFQASLPLYEQAVKSKNNSAEYLMALGDNQLQLKQYDRAIVQYGRVVGFEPNNAKAYYNLGLTYVGLNNKIAARQQVRKLESLDKDLAKKLSNAIGDK